ncbi:RNA polymerase factor sigma-54 [Thermopetrobacter sp. TC1]|uniref:RNA polymerase factor sigma-54 n=1 Tax=Thermopetrobacter sp. TC1 TaxID=1495045 RepID=UPI00056E9FB0|nr:RNA polymerase factor sigma-54 [Thermopetrobacter sp. TC1]
MTLRQRLDVRQSQTLVMTPQLQQAIRLLQMSNLELQAFIAAELETNPLLERADEAQEVPETPEAPEAEAGATGDAPDPGAESVPDGNAPAAESDDALSLEADLAAVDAGFEDTSRLKARLDALDTPAEAIFTDDSPSERATEKAAEPLTPDAAMSGLAGGDDPFLSGVASAVSRPAPADEEEGRSLEERIAGEVSLADHLAEQLPLVLTDPAERLIGQHLIGCLDEAGYLGEPVEEIADRLGAAPEQVEAVLKRLQTLEPTGVFARDLAECLRLQLAERGRLNTPMQTLLDNLDLLARRDFAKLARLCRVSERKLAEMLSEIRRCDPRPGARIGGAPAQPVVPDVFVRPAPDGSWIVELNSETLPRVLVNNQYRALVQAGAMPQRDRDYIIECMNRASWLVKSLDQRARTILTVAREIVRQQDAFLHKGVSALKPLTLRQVADAVGLHESTVSRVTSGKYMATPRGIFEMKYFFTAALAATDGGESVSAEAVRHRIRALIDAEDPDHVLSDDKIVDILRAEGIDIARRTVAKYREAMGIPSSVKRRREKRLLKA